MVDGRVVRDPEHPVDVGRASIHVDGEDAARPVARYLVLNKPRGLVTTASDERGRETVYRCFDGAGLGWIAPVGRLDQASEGLLLFTNDPGWAAAITDPARGPDKTYHVQVDACPGAFLLESMMRGVFALGRTSEITIDQLPPTIAEYAARRDLTMLEQLEVDGIINALIKCGGNKVVAAEMLGVSRSTLYRKMGTYKLDAERFFF